ncbi:MAG: hypothetical protein WDN69_05820 [Aliidongia sp.]
MVGARFLTGCDDFVMSDMGGTTTDIAVVRGGHPVTERRGRLRRRLEDHGRGGRCPHLRAGRRQRAGIRRTQHHHWSARVVPLSLFASTRPEMLDALRAIRCRERPPQHPGRFAFRAGPIPMLRGKGRDADLGRALRRAAIL